MEYMGYVSDNGTFIFPKEFSWHMHLVPGTKVVIDTITQSLFSLRPQPQTVKKKSIVDWFGKFKLEDGYDINNLDALVEKAVLENDQY